jgi:hypothetical protein
MLQMDGDISWNTGPRDSDERFTIFIAINTYNNQTEWAKHEWKRAYEPPYRWSWQF